MQITDYPQVLLINFSGITVIPTPFRFPKRLRKESDSSLPLTERNRQSGSIKLQPRKEKFIAAFAQPVCVSAIVEAVESNRG